MRSALRHRTRLAARRFDSWLESQAGRILPRNLTKRYVLGFGVVATIVCATQLLEQASFTLQGRAFRQARLLDAQRETSLVFSRAVEQLRSPAPPGMLSDRLEIAESAFRSLSERHKAIVSDHHPVYIGFGDQHTLDEYYQLASLSLGEAGTWISGIRTALADDDSRAHDVDEALRAEQTYRATQQVWHVL